MCLVSPLEPVRARTAPVCHRRLLCCVRRRECIAPSQPLATAWRRRDHLDRGKSLLVLGSILDRFVQRAAHREGVRERAGAFDPRQAPLPVIVSSIRLDQKPRARVVHVLCRQAHVRCTTALRLSGPQRIMLGFVLLRCTSVAPKPCNTSFKAQSSEASLASTWHSSQCSFASFWPFVVVEQ